MIYKKSEIDITLVTCTYEEQKGYISIEDEYTNNLLKLSGYSDIDEECFFDLCGKGVFVDKLLSYALKSPQYGYWYARDALKGRFELGEPAIATFADYSFWYAKNALKGRFELGEPAIATNAYYSFKYAYYVFEGRFELGEPSIATNRNYKKQYEERFGVNL